MLPSTIRYSRSGSPAMVSKTRFHIPLWDQRLYRTYTRCQWPNSGGMSRQGEPVRIIQRTASRKRRLSLAVTPQSAALPGNKGVILSHWSSRNTLPCYNSTVQNGVAYAMLMVLRLTFPPCCMSLSSSRRTKVPKLHLTSCFGVRFVTKTTFTRHLTPQFRTSFVFWHPRHLAHIGISSFFRRASRLRGRKVAAQRYQPS